MSFVDRRQEVRPASGEAPFGFDETFFSRTDDRGVIQAGNYVFRRVSGYDWTELLNAPHKIIRHSDTPKGVFWLLWDTLKRGDILGAYVKNKAKDGLSYWVYATAMPCGDGYLSARIKPGSPVFDVARKEYKKLLKAEKEQGLSPEDSAHLLLENLKKLGYQSYADFSTHAICEELSFSDIQTGRKPDKGLIKSRKAQEDAKNLTNETIGMIGDFGTMRTIPHNMRVIASRLEPTGGPVSTLSQNYGSMSQEISDWFDSNVNGKDSDFSTIAPRVTNSLFLRCVVRILSDVTNELDNERRNMGGIDKNSERKILKDLQVELTKSSSREYGRVSEEAVRISNACKVMHRQVLGLSTTRVMCKIEGARMNGKGESLDDIITQLDAFQSRINSRLERISHLSGAIQTT